MADSCPAIEMLKAKWKSSIKSIYLSRVPTVDALIYATNEISNIRVYKTS